jgi:hypothetical protein
MLHALINYGVNKTIIKVTGHIRLLYNLEREKLVGNFFQHIKNHI